MHENIRTVTLDDVTKFVTRDSNFRPPKGYLETRLRSRYCMRVEIRAPDGADGSRRERASDWPTAQSKRGSERE